MLVVDETGFLNAYYLCHGPAGAGAGEFARVARSRWAVEECFEAAKGECGPDHGEGRTWHAWHRHVTLPMLALAVLAAIRSRCLAPPGGAPASPEKKARG